MNLHTALIVAGDGATTATLADILAQNGCNFECAASNEAALARVTESQFDLIVTDESTPGSEDLELLRKLRRVRPHTRLIILTAESTPTDVISAMRERAFSYFSKPFSASELAGMIKMALKAPCWDDGIEVVSATPTWIRLLARGDKETADRLLQFINEIADLPEDEKHDVGLALRELLLNAVEHGTRFDPDKFVEVSYIRAKRMVSCRVKDPGEGFSLDELDHAAISNAPHDPIRHVLYREAAGLRPGGYGILLARHLVDELMYGERGNDVLLIKYLGVPSSTLKV
jgi:CheY-like chemotaxis protein